MPVCDELTIDKNLNAAQQLIYIKGYEQMAIQDILSTLNISKSASYHYFDSKHARIEAIVERMAIEAEKILTLLCKIRTCLRWLG